ncbi:glycosyltransferase [Nonlabens marinus]|uniref:N-acetylglucosaminyltransferase n=1 Tax=Nonlabens marinus S1-08 TaxID=1454201 RepID=W8VVY7_9FLAO|nr:glycosyltransferase [Nonlabens marinus]BAO54282.1 N-acetylglucosaminyltransferase [Nonlabens marinus S1-08]
MEIGLPFYTLLIVVIINLTYYLYFAKSAYVKQALPSKSSSPVSVIVCAKNEAQNLLELVPLLLNQTHPDFEIILINDASSDDTRSIVEDFSSKHQNVQMVDVVNNETFWANKKYALTLGIKKAKNDQLVFIDADCRPSSSEWLSLMSAPLSGSNRIVLGYGGYEKVKDSILNRLIRFETVFTAMQYMGYALRGNPYMGVGRNLAYTAQQFYDVSGFMAHMRIMGGDDDLFINEAATAENTAVQLDPDSFAISKPKTTWAQWWTQKKRHVSTAKHYKRKHKCTLGLFFLSQFFFILSTIVAFIFETHWEIIMVLVVLRYLVVMIIMGRGLSRFRESELLPLLPLLELLLIGTQIGLFFSNTNSQPKRWK